MLTTQRLPRFISCRDGSGAACAGGQSATICRSVFRVRPSPLTLCSLATCQTECCSSRIGRSRTAHELNGTERNDATETKAGRRIIQGVVVRSASGRRTGCTTGDGDGDGDGGERKHDTENRSGIIGAKLEERTKRKGDDQAASRAKGRR